MESVVGVVLAAGRGLRLRPLTRLRPKALCTVDKVPLVDLALDRVRPAVVEVAVNLHDGREALDAHLPDDVHRSIELDGPLGTAGALAQLQSWIDGRGTLVVNVDAWCPGSLLSFTEGWDRERIRLLLAGDDELTPTSRVAGALLPWRDVSKLDTVPSGLYEASWRIAQAAGRVEVVRHDGQFVDCGTPERYLTANMEVSGGASVVEDGAAVDGTLDRCVVWAGAEVHARESLRSAIRLPGISVLVR